MNNSVIVIDVGSSKIIAVSGERGVNGTFAIDAFSELRYAIRSAKLRSRVQLRPLCNTLAAATAYSLSE